MICQKHKFIFIQIPKTATTSISKVIRPFSDLTKEEQKIVITPALGKLWRNALRARHSTYNEYAAKHPEECKNFFKFAFVRNPWCRMASFYIFQKNSNFLALPSLSATASFKDFLLASEDYIELTQYDYVNGFDDNSFIGRFENLQQDFDIICDKIGIPRQKLPHSNKTEHKHYAEYYDDETREIVAQKYADDIKFFGYKFGD